MNLDQALARVAEIQADLEAGRLAVPYPPPVSQELVVISDVFAAHCTTPERARELVQAINAGVARREPAELPW